MSKSKEEESISVSNSKKLTKLLQIYLADDDVGINKEVEVKFGTKGFRQITRIDFENVIQKLKSLQFYSLPNSDILRIQNEFLDERTGRTMISNIRTEIVGVTQIQSYCKKNRILTDDQSSLPYNINFVQKQKKKHGTNPVHPINFDDFNFRVSYNTEKTISHHSGIIKSIISKWSDSRKIFRLLSRSTFIHDDFPFKIDCSIVKSSRKEHHKLVPAFTISESELFQNPETFEIEIEIDNNAIAEKDMSVKQVEISLRNVIKIILSGLQQTNFPVAYSEQDDVMNKYMELIHGKQSDYGRIYPKHFIGPSSYTLQMENIIKNSVDNGAVSIRQPYTVTDKADGERKMLFIANTGKIYLIDTNMNVQFTGTITKEKKLFLTLMDGELIQQNKHGKFINLYAAFDIYFMAGKDVRNKQFVKYEKEGTVSDDKKEQDKKDTKVYRLNLLNNCISAIKHVSVIDGGIPPMRIEAKVFYISKQLAVKDTTVENLSIFKACSKVMNKVNDGLMEYETDGLIFTPAMVGVGVNTAEEKSKNYKITWDMSFKWKPPQFNTIDFLISTKKDETGSEIINTLFQEGTSTSHNDQIRQYKTLTLRVGFDEKRHGFVNPYNDLIKGVMYNDREENDSNYKPLPFYPTNPYDPNASTCFVVIEQDSNGINQMFTENREETFMDNTIVEFRYNKDADAGWRWIPIRVRHDKTSEYKKGLKNYGNAYHVAESNWKSIHNPITEEMITTGKDIPEESEDFNVYYNRKSSKTNTRALRDFHNMYVKRKLIMGGSTRGGTLIDLAVGKAGDLQKWMAAKLDFIFGIDVSRDNIENRLDGACARYLKLRKRNKIMPKIMFANGNSGLNIRNGDAMFSDMGKRITNAVFGSGPKDAEKIGKGVYNIYGKGKDGFNVASCQFALHYFFENTRVLQEFLRNVSECLAVEGYFIGTCYDGERLFNILKDKDKGEGFAINQKGTKIYEVIKQYETSKFNDDENSVGLAIDVYQESINKTFREYLVNFDYLVRVLENYGLVPLTKEECKLRNLPNSHGPFSELFGDMEKELKQRKYSKSNVGAAPDMTPEEKRISFMNRYFIFKKVRNVDTSSITLDITSIKQEIEKELVKSKEDTEKSLDKDDDTDEKADDKADDKTDGEKKEEQDEKAEETEKKPKKKKLKLKKLGKKLVLPDDSDKEKEEEQEIQEPKVKRKVLEFYSKSRDKDDIGSGFKDWRKRLSNFWVDETGKTIRIGDSDWPTVEHWFQANKFMHDDSAENKAYVDKFKAGNEFDADAGKGKGSNARKMGGKTASKRAKVAFDPEWDTKSEQVMLEGLKAKIEQFPDVKAILRKVKEDGRYLVHFEAARGKTESKWGALVDKEKKKNKTATEDDITGQNLLGNMYMDLLKTV
tara:strand:- start:488 stop:4642 length:4155 start_codon:yes stop_codon:yes gene_type:complete